jgi:hypothetical protein
MLMKNNTLSTATVALLFALMVPSAFAIQQSYTINDFTVSVDPALFTIGAFSEPAPFVLDDGQSATFDLFTITGGPVGSSPLSTTIDFSDPLAQVTIGGNAILHPPPPPRPPPQPPGRPFLEVTMGAGSTIVLTDRTFEVQANYIPTTNLTGTVQATITQRTPSASVPDVGSTLMLLGIGLSALAAYRKTS